MCEILTDKKYYIVTVTFQGHPMSKVMVPNERLCMFLSMNNSNYMSNRNHFKDIGTFLSKELLIPSHVTRNALDDPKNSEMFCT